MSLMWNEKDGVSPISTKPPVIESELKWLLENSFLEHTFFKGHLKKIIPHRGKAVKIGGYVKKADEQFGFRYLNQNDPIFKGHFPGNPVCPNDELDEMFNITAAVFFKLNMAEIPGFPAIRRKDGIDYRNPARPGDLLKITAGLRENKRNKFFVFSGRIVNQINEIVATYENILGAAVQFT